MNRLLKPLSFALALLLVLALFPISARADTGFAVDSNGYTTPTDTSDHSLQISFYLTYNGSRIDSRSDLPPEVTGVTVFVQSPNGSVIDGGERSRKSSQRMGFLTSYSPPRQMLPTVPIRCRFWLLTI